MTRYLHLEPCYPDISPPMAVSFPHGLYSPKPRYNQVTLWGEVWEQERVVNDNYDNDEHRTIKMKTMQMKTMRTIMTIRTMMALPLRMYTLTE